MVSEEMKAHEMPAREAVSSSNIVAIAYDPDAHLLEVEFTPKADGTKAVWRYCPVDAEVYAAMTAPGASVGSVFARQVRANASIAQLRVE